MKWRAAVLACALLMFLAAIFAQQRINAARPQRNLDTLLYLPNEKLLGYFSGGMNSVIADLLWLQCIQYTAREVKGAGSFTWLDRMVNTVVNLDPYFTDAYRFGGMFLAALKAEDDASLALLERGMRKQPDAWQLPYEAAMIFLLNRRDQPDSPRRAAYYLGMSAATGKSPEVVRNLAAQLQGKYDLTGIEQQMWLDLANGSDKLLQEMAKRKLVELKLREECKILNERIEAYAGQYGHPPDTLGDLINARIIRSVPPDPLGGEFFLDPEHHAQSSTLLDALKAQNASIITTALQKYHEKNQFWPQDLDTLVREKYLKELPPQPWPGRTWKYDPAAGTIE